MLIRIVSLVLVLLSACVDMPDEPSTTFAPLTTCGQTRLAPPPFVDAGGLGVAVDVERIAASFTFDLPDERSSARATVTFSLGPEAGHPVLDLRQPIIAAWLDDEPLALDADLVRREPSLTRPGTVLVIRRALDACTRHTLIVDYALRPADVESFDTPRFVPDGSLRWASNFSDFVAGGLLERWVPAPITLDDTFAIDFDILLVDPSLPHTLVSNGDVIRTGRAAWHITWPADSDLMTPLFYVSSAISLEHLDDPDGLVEVHYSPGLVANFGGDPRDLLTTAHDAVVELTARFGPRRFGSRPYLVVFAPVTGAMEYPNGTILSAFFLDDLRHEITHAWIGRTLAPARHQDAWFDEGLTTLLIAKARSSRLLPMPLDPWSESALPIASPEPWFRRTLMSAYTVGPRFFETLYEHFGDAAVDGVIRDLVRRCSGRHVTHHDLRRAFGTLGDPDFVDALFSHWVIPTADHDTPGTCDLTP